MSNKLRQPPLEYEKQKGMMIAYVPNFFFKITLVIFQYALRYFLLICTFICEMRKVYAVSTRRFTGGLEYDHMQRDLGNLSKLPKHMSFVINEDVPTDYCDVTNLIVWTIAMGIPYITLYDCHGILKASEVRLGKMLKEKIAVLFGPIKAENMSVVLKNSPRNGEVVSNCPRKVCIQLLSQEDGKADIMETARRIASDYSHKNVPMKDISIDYVHKSLRATKNMPDPDMVVQFGPVHSLMGFLPWQTRLSEILHVKSIRNINYNKYYELLQKYSKCNQRLGK